MVISFSIYLASKTRWAHLYKSVELESVPRKGEYIKFTNQEMGDYFGFEVVEVTYRENGNIEVMTELLDNIDNRGYSFEEEGEFDEYYTSYIREGWYCDRGIVKNTRVKSN